MQDEKWEQKIRWDKKKKKKKNNNNNKHAGEDRNVDFVAQGQVPSQPVQNEAP
jgi:hypothetical protein